MIAPDALHRILAYDQWANEAAHASLACSPQTPGAATRWMAHIVASEHLWLSRIEERAAPLPVWPEIDLDVCREWLGRLPALWSALLRGGEERLSRPVRYTNTRGEAFDSLTGDIALHVALHSAHHRGQIASALRAVGHEPAVTDFIHAVRTGAVR